MNDRLRALARALPSWLSLGTIAHQLRWALLSSVLCLLIIATCEYYYGRGLTRYTTRHFLTDALYRPLFIIYLALIYNPLLEWVRQIAPGLNLAILARWPLWASLPVYWLVFDFLSYWIHRAQHSRIWWRFHRIHHSQEVMTFASGFRNHPIDQMFALMVSLVPSLLLGAPAIAWAPYSFLLTFIDATHHSPLPWRLAPIRKVFVSPIFHMAHHSTDPAVHNRNYGGLLSIWDFLFGTAYDADALPTRTGVEGWAVKESIWAHLISPFSRHTIKS